MKIDTRARTVRSILALLVAASISLAGYDNNVAKADVSGSTYTSPNYGYSITWSSPWYVTEDDTESNGFDVLGLADGRSVVYVSGGISNQGSASNIIADYATQMQQSSDWVSFTPIDASQCPIASSGTDTAAACYRGDHQYDDDSQRSVGVLLQAWNLGNGLDLLLEAYVEEDQFASYLTTWQQFGIYPPGQAAPPSTSGCNEVVTHGVAFCFDPSLSERDQSDITEAVRLGQDVIATYFGNPDLSDVRIYGFGSVAPDGDENLATTLDRSIAVYIGSIVWQGIAPLERIETLVHELFHVYQNAMTDESSAVVPLWFTEGSAEAVGYLGASQLGVADQSDFYDLSAYSLTQYPVSGSLQDLQPIGSMTADDYPLAYIAVQYALGSRGLSVAALGDLYTQLQQGATFEDAFASVFGLTLGQFYAEFEAWRPGLQKVTELPADFWPNDGGTSPASVSVQSAPQQADPDDQIVIVAKTAPLTDCDATLPFNGETLQRQTFANGEGEVYWLITIPETVTPGPVTMTLSCGSTPVTTVISLT